MNAKHVSDLTIDEFTTLIRAIVRDVILEMEDEDDPDEGLEFKPEVAEYLRKAMKEKKRGTPSAEVMKELGIE